MSDNKIKLTRNRQNEGKKRPTCACGTEMTFTKYEGYYDEREYWICENPECKAEDYFAYDIISKGAYA